MKTGMTQVSGPTGGAFPLALAADGEALRIVDIRGGQGLRERLASRGLGLGSRVRVAQTEGPGGMVLHSGGSRIALGMGMAYRILVQAEG